MSVVLVTRGVDIIGRNMRCERARRLDRRTRLIVGLTMDTEYIRTERAGRVPRMQRSLTRGQNHPDECTFFPYN